MELNLCDHCGESVDYHADCDRQQLRNAVDEFQNQYAQSKVLSMAIHVNYLNGISDDALETRILNKLQETNETTEKIEKREKKEKKKKREKKLQELLMKVSALRNFRVGGYLLIQLVGLAAEDTFTGAFDEFADQKLNELIDDGSLFCDTFKKNTFKGGRFISLHVESTPFVYTFDPQTKIALDSSIVTPSPSTMRELIKKKKNEDKDEDEDEEYVCFPPVIDKESKITESRSLQLKSCEENSDGLVYWDKLKLRHCISAFAKNKNGGVYILGIKEIEEKVEGKEYISKKYSIRGMKESVCEEIRTNVLEETKNSLIIYDYNGEVMEGIEPIQVTLTAAAQFDNVDEKYKENFILQVAVRHINGIVYYDKDGPLAYKMAENGSEIEKITYPNWLKFLKDGKKSTLP